jgi:hypothetical protein
MLESPRYSPPHRQFPDVARAVCTQGCECWQVELLEQHKARSCRIWLGWADSNLRMAGSKPAALSACRVWRLTQDRSAFISIRGQARRGPTRPMTVRVPMRRGVVGGRDFSKANPQARRRHSLGWRNAPLNPRTRTTDLSLCSRSIPFAVASQLPAKLPTAILAALPTASHASFATSPYNSLVASMSSRGTVDPLMDRTDTTTWPFTSGTYRTRKDPQPLRSPGIGTSLPCS